MAAATCLGFELLNFLVAGANSSVLTGGFDSENLTLPLDFTANGSSSRMMTAAGATAVLVPQCCVSPLYCIRSGRRTPSWTVFVVLVTRVVVGIVHRLWLVGMA